MSNSIHLKKHNGGARNRKCCIPNWNTEFEMSTITISKYMVAIMIRITTFTEVGGHKTNEDAFIVREAPEQPGSWFCVLADGQGGQAGGGPAAQLACSSAIDLAINSAVRSLLRSHWDSILRTADQTVANDPQAGCTTLIGFLATDEWLVGASCGDSAVLVVSANEKPRIATAHQLKNPPVGSGEAMFVPFSLKLITPWAIIAMTDGVWKYVGWDAIVEAVQEYDGQELIEMLQVKARMPGNGRFQDDFTIVLLESHSV